MLSSYSEKLKFSKKIQLYGIELDAELKCSQNNPKMLQNEFKMLSAFSWMPKCSYKLQLYAIELDAKLKILGW